jgi:exodeoxyribonuclease VII large subunit
MRSSEADRLDVYTVTEITDAIRQHLETEFPRVSILGETANVKAHTSGHWYFTLRDSAALINAVLFRRYAETLPFRLEDGMMVVASGRLSHFGAQGRTQLIAVDVIPAGKGDLEIEFRKLLEKLMREGLTSPERKRALPPYPERIVVITSPTGAVIKDIADTLARRWPVAEVIRVDAEVQGPGAARSIVQAFEIANGMEGVDTVILARGGGSIEDLWAFNLEEVARAVAGSVHPVVTGIGHEIDTTVADYVADLRAATPTAAAELATPLAAEVAARCQRLFETLRVRSVDGVANGRHLVEYLLRSGAFPALLHRLERGGFEVDALLDDMAGWWERERGEAERALESRRLELDGRMTEGLRRLESTLGAHEACLARRSPEATVRRAGDAVRHAVAIVGIRLAGAIASRRKEWRGAKRALSSLDPRGVLKRGYTFCTGPDGAPVISRSSEVSGGDRMLVNFYDGGALCTVERKRKGTSWRKE